MPARFRMCPVHLQGRTAAVLLGRSQAERRLLDPSCTSSNLKARRHVATPGPTDSLAVDFCAPGSPAAAPATGPQSRRPRAAPPATPPFAPEISPPRRCSRCWPAPPAPRCRRSGPPPLRRCCSGLLPPLPGARAGLLRAALRSACKTQLISILISCYATCTRQKGIIVRGAFSMVTGLSQLPMPCAWSPTRI